MDLRTPPPRATGSPSPSRFMGRSGACCSYALRARVPGPGRLRIIRRTRPRIPAPAHSGLPFPTNPPTKRGTSGRPDRYQARTAAGVKPDTTDQAQRDNLNGMFGGHRRRGGGSAPAESLSASIPGGPIKRSVRRGYRIWLALALRIRLCLGRSTTTLSFVEEG